MPALPLKVVVPLLCVAMPAFAGGEATVTLAAYRAAPTATVSPSERLMAVYKASPQRATMLERRGMVSLAIRR